MLFIVDFSILVLLQKKWKTEGKNDFEEGSNLLL